MLKRLGDNRLSVLEPADAVHRYKRDKLGELIHIDIKKLGKFNRVDHRTTGDRIGRSNSRGAAGSPFKSPSTTPSATIMTGEH